MRITLIVFGALCVWLAAVAASEADMEWKLQWGSPVEAELVKLTHQGISKGLGHVMYWNLVNMANESFGTQIVMMNPSAFPFTRLRREFEAGSSDLVYLLGNPPLYTSFLVGEWCHKGLVVGDPFIGSCAHGVPIYGYVDEERKNIYSDHMYQKTPEEIKALEDAGLVKLRSVGTTVDDGNNNNNENDAESLGSYIGRLLVILGMGGCFASVLYLYTVKGTFILPPTASARAFHNQVYADIMRKKK